MRPIRGILLITALASVAAASSMCTTALMSVYTASGFSCQLDDKIFSSFSYSSSDGGHGVAPTAAGVTVTPDPTPGNPGFHFSSNLWTVFSLVTDGFDSFVDSSISFTVATISGQPLIEDNTLTLDSYSVSGVGGFVEIDESFNPDPSGNGLHVSAYTDPILGLVAKTVDHTVFAPVSSIRVSKDLNVAAQAGTNSTATIIQFSENFSENVPEPGSLLLIGCGLIGFGALRRRR